MSAFPTIASITTLFVGTMFSLPPQPTQAEGLPVFPPSPLVTTVLPTSTTGVFLVNACPDAWAELNRLNPFAGKFNGAGLQRLLPDGMEFTRDIQPWLGNHLALALLPPDPATGKSSSPVIVISVAHQDQFDAFLNQLKAIRGTPQIERIDADLTLLYWQPAQNAPDPDEQTDGSQPGSNSPNQPKALSTRPDKANQILQDVLPIPLSVPNPEQVLRRQGLAIAQFPRYLAISNQLAPLEQLQTPRTGQPTLATNPQFKRTLQPTIRVIKSIDQ